MKAYHLFILLLVIFLLPASGFAAGNAGGKKVFLDNKCNKCHTIKSEGISQLPKSEEAGEEEEEEDAAEKVDPPDLAKLGDGVLKAASTPDESLRKWLKKEVSVTYKGKPRKHKKQFNGTETDLNSLIQFLQGK